MLYVYTGHETRLYTIYRTADTIATATQRLPHTCIVPVAVTHGLSRSGIALTVPITKVRVVKDVGGRASMRGNVSDEANTTVKEGYALHSLCHTRRRCRQCNRRMKAEEPSLQPRREVRRDDAGLPAARR